MSFEAAVSEHGAGDCFSKRSQPSMHNSAIMTPNFLFGDRDQRRSIMMNSHHRTPRRGAHGGGKNVTWSPNLIQRAPCSRPSESETNVANMVNPPSLNLTNPRNGPPLRSLGDVESKYRPQPREAEITDDESGLQYSGPKESEHEFWVKIVGHKPEDIDEVVKFFSRHGSLVSFKIPEDGNWLWVRYASTIHVAQALSLSGRYFQKNVMLGVLPCSDDNDVPSQPEGVLRIPVVRNASTGVDDRKDSPVPTDNATGNSTDISMSQCAAIRPLSTMFRPDNSVSVFPQENPKSNFLETLWNIIAP
ncbi:hypothetical protein QR680_013177 [Steinernema hermaphroditum]|uniref:Nucleoporin NUP35 n=1 Tax=Steinernema hermaphroditum TaxID=289476 RepID=A0AA39I778_9BILA|nr:hypothetical protein QR680_013177 [Steinernema hermaphroditum]